MKQISPNLEAEMPLLETTSQAHQCANYFLAGKALLQIPEQTLEYSC